MMTWLLTWLNVSVAKLNATLQILVIYRYRLNLEEVAGEIEYKSRIYGGDRLEIILVLLVF